MLIGKLVKIRAIEREDLPTILKWRNSPEVYETMFEHEILSMADQEKWFAEIFQAKDKLVFIITTISDKPLGIINLFDIDWRSRTAEWGFYIGRKANRMSGFAAEAAFLIFKYAFEHLNLHRLYARTFAFNKKAISFHERLGIKKEGILRQHIYHNNKYEDVVVTGILKDEFSKRIPALESTLQRINK